VRGPGWLGYEETIELSSVLTPVYKFAFPAAFGAVLIVAAAVRAWEIAVPFAVAALFLLLLAAPLKRVWLRGGTLVVSNYFRSCEVACTEIAEVLEKRLINVRPVWVFFKAPTPFGTRLAFIPRLSAVPFWKTPPWSKCFGMLLITRESETKSWAIVTAFGENAYSRECEAVNNQQNRICSARSRRRVAHWYLPM